MDKLAVILLIAVAFGYVHARDKTTEIDVPRDWQCGYTDEQRAMAINMGKRAGRRRSSYNNKSIDPELGNDTTEDRFYGDDTHFDLLLPPASRDESNSPTSMSQDAEDGPDFNGLNKTRPPMNQEEFDMLFKYEPPEVRTSEFVRRAAKFSYSCTKPCRSPKDLLCSIVNFFPIFSWLGKYDWKDSLAADAIGGLTLAIVHIPQGIAYSVLAGVPPIVGLYISFFPPLFYMLFGTARHNSIGSFAVVALMTRMAVDEFTLEPRHNGTRVNTFPEDIQDNIPYYPEVVASTLAFTIGICHFLMGVLRLEIITTYFSDAVVGGFSTAAACHVFVTQLKDFFGLQNIKQHTGAFNLFYKLVNIVVQIPQSTNLITLIIALTSFLFLIVGKHFVNPFLKKRLRLSMPIPFELVLIIASTLLAYLFHIRSNYGVIIVGKLPTGMPAPRLPAFELIPHLLPHALSICVVVAAVHISLAKMFGKKLHYSIDSGQELYALGFTSMFSSFFPIYPPSCSLGRTVVNVDAGTKTQLSTVFSSTIIAAVIVYFGQMLRTLPMCVLSAVIMVALTGMLSKVQELKKLWPLSKFDFAIWLVSFLATVIWDVTEGLGVAIVFALLTTVFRTQFPRWHYLANLKGTNDFRDAERYHNIIDVNGICIFRFDAPLLFTNVERFKRNIHSAALRWKSARPKVLTPQDIVAIKVPEIEKTVEHLNDIVTKTPTVQPVPFRRPTSGLMYRHFIIDCSGMTFVDTMGVNALKEIFSELRSHMILVYFAAAKTPVRDLFYRCGFYEYVPKSNFYPTIRDAVAIAKKRRSASTLHLLEEMSLEFDPLQEAISTYTVSCVLATCLQIRHIITAPDGTNARVKETDLTSGFAYTLHAQWELGRLNIRFWRAEVTTDQDYMLVHNAHIEDSKLTITHARGITAINDNTIKYSSIVRAIEAPIPMTGGKPLIKHEPPHKLDTLHVLDKHVEVKGIQDKGVLVIGNGRGIHSMQLVDA
ncbi:STAS domain-containing protein [Aphelenchoides bicaudatus]|nr:STAS domain-containing protein [Aphelenchoides bicaudatus]